MFQVLLFYRYCTIKKPQSLALAIRAEAQRLGLRGRVLLAEEGINATLEGDIPSTEAFAEWIKRDVRFADMGIKRSRTEGNSFPKLSIKVRKEIVGTHFPEEVDPREATAPRVSPEELRAMYASGEDFVVVDMRNSYEYASGHFANSVDPGMKASRDLPQAMARLERYKGKKIITVCTGGVRCEKMSAYLLRHGFSNVYQLEEGIHAYMEKFPGKDFLGTLYTFDGRIRMDFGGNRTVIGTCTACASVTEDYGNCAYDECHVHMLLCKSCQAPKAPVYCSPRCRVFAMGWRAKRQFRALLVPLRRFAHRYTRRVRRAYYRLLWKARLRSRTIEA